MALISYSIFLFFSVQSLRSENLRLRNDTCSKFQYLETRAQYQTILHPKEGDNHRYRAALQLHIHFPLCFFVSIMIAEIRKANFILLKIETST